MRCEKCAGKTRVTGTKAGEGAVVRGRKCMACGHTMRTRETCIGSPPAGTKSISVPVVELALTELVRSLQLTNISGTRDPAFADTPGQEADPSCTIPRIPV